MIPPVASAIDSRPNPEGTCIPPQLNGYPRLGAGFQEREKRKEERVEMDPE